MISSRWVSTSGNLCIVRRSPRILRDKPARRTFLSSSSQTLRASRELPYSRQAVYELIADIKAYPHFLPYCLDARILSWSLPDTEKRRWPASAELTVGWGAIKEQYTSQVHCVPGRIVESLAGEAQSLLSEDDRCLSHDLEQRRSETRGGDVFRSLRSTWTLHNSEENPTHATTVELEIAFEFQSQLYAALAGAAVPRIAGKVMEAFEARARQVLAAGAHT